MTKYSKDDELVLNHFFTNLDKPIFFVRNMHPEVWALMQARYSRSTEGLREGFLGLLKEDQTNFKKLAEALRDTRSHVEIKHATDAAINFMEKWVLGYGHASIAEGAVVGVGLEGISILATKVIEDNRLCSFTEKSTRYVKFDEDSFYIDKVLKESKYGKEIEETIKELFGTYTKLNEPVLNYIKSIAPPKEGQSVAAWERACAARAFDSIRYMLPACTKTSLGWTVNARNLAHAIMKLLSHPIPEMYSIGTVLREEGKIVLPSLLKYADENSYLVETEKDMSLLSDKLNITEQGIDSTPVKLVEHSHDIDDTIVSVILYRYSRAPYSRIKEKVKKMSEHQKEEVLKTYLGKMGQFDWPMRELEHVYFVWDVFMDYGAFRDLQRHRICTQTNQVLTTFEGYSIPPDIINAGVKDEYDIVMQKCAKLFEKVYKDYPLFAQYLVPLGFKKRFLFTANLREMYHLIKLRTTPQGHFSYRNIARNMYDILKKSFPFAAKYIVCSMTDEELGRLKSELKIQEKIDNASTPKS